MLSAQISSSSRTLTSSRRRPILEILSKCLYVKFSEMELLPQLPHPSVVDGENPLKKLPPAVVADGAFTTSLDTDNTSPTRLMLSRSLE